MSKIYAVGDVQGCAPSLKALLKKLPKKSKMIFLGDLVNRGPDSLGALRQLKVLQESGRAECILFVIPKRMPKIEKLRKLPMLV